MEGHQYHYSFSPSVDIVDVEATVTLAVLATESLHGESRVRLESNHVFDADKRMCVMDAASKVGRDLNQLFLGFISREFGPESFRVRQVEHATEPSAAA